MQWQHHSVSTRHSTCWQQMGTLLSTSAEAECVTSKCATTCCGCGGGGSNPGCGCMADCCCGAATAAKVRAVAADAPDGAPSCGSATAVGGTELVIDASFASGGSRCASVWASPPTRKQDVAAFSSVYEFMLTDTMQCNAMRDINICRGHRLACIVQRCKHVYAVSLMRSKDVIFSWCHKFAHAHLHYCRRCRWRWWWHCCCCCESRLLFWPLHMRCRADGSPHEPHEQSEHEWHESPILLTGKIGRVQQSW